MVICSLDALKMYSKKKGTRIKKETVEVLQQASYRRKRSTMTLISSFAIIFFIMRRVSYLKNRQFYVDIIAF